MGRLSMSIHRNDQRQHLLRHCRQLECMYVMRLAGCMSNNTLGLSFFDSLFNKRDCHFWQGVLRTNEEYTEACSFGVLLPVGCFWAFVNTQEYDIVEHMCSGP